MSIHFQVNQMGGGEEKGTWMLKVTERGKNVWSLFASLGWRCGIRINVLAFLRM